MLLQGLISIKGPPLGKKRASGENVSGKCQLDLTTTIGGYRSEGRRQVTVVCITIKKSLTASDS
jgi:hypothetical protein